ncbi:hypothetical protein P154DRAFT_135393 [Amniculicola lignicola CBS 123094]|uniref:Uncharacterized protein n=1 Tax=Amniculicola lignicola CBS 123094 TaxID=1392246 RepID=A0A6A5WL83_9PLEO|nr:hypothetical protein P154DRAFT_135393 [Amniculicola lignicola CBS 123094]
MCNPPRLVQPLQTMALITWPCSVQFPRSCSALQTAIEQIGQTIGRTLAVHATHRQPHSFWKGSLPHSCGKESGIGQPQSYDARRPRCKRDAKLAIYTMG